MPRSMVSWIDLPDINVWLALVYDGHQHHKQAIGWTDTYLAALAQVNELPLVTFDHGFRHFRELTHLIL